MRSLRRSALCCTPICALMSLAMPAQVTGGFFRWLNRQIVGASALAALALGPIVLDPDRFAIPTASSLKTYDTPSTIALPRDNRGNTPAFDSAMCDTGSTIREKIGHSARGTQIETAVSAWVLGQKDVTRAMALRLLHDARKQYVLSLSQALQGFTEGNCDGWISARIAGELTKRPEVARLETLAIAAGATQEQLRGKTRPHRDGQPPQRVRH
jgi:hypothetical protein